MGGFCFVYNDAFFHNKGAYTNKNTGNEVRVDYLENYYFENMCDIPMFFKQFPVDRVFRIEGAYDGMNIDVQPLLRSIPIVSRIRGYSSAYSSRGGKRRGKTQRKSRRGMTKKRRQ